VEPFLLPAKLEIEPNALARLTKHYEEGLLADTSVRIGDVLGNDYGIDIRAKYGPFDLEHPIGKASGQLSLQAKQVETDAQAGLAFVVLKTVIAESADGAASMDAWKIRKPRMVVEEIEGKRVARKGWTVSWAGRGWEESLESYLTFMGEALVIGTRAGMPVIPSCKYNLPTREEEEFLELEYEFTTKCFARVWDESGIAKPLTLEQDFSPTLAGTDAAQSKRLILKWLGDSPALIKKFAPDMQLGVKLMNAIFDDEFQMEMMRLVSRKDAAADFLICFNRLFDPERMFGDKKGIAYGGPDLSDRNLEMMREAMHNAGIERRLPISATGDIVSGRMMVEYALRGATSGQLHTYFQLPMERFRLKGVSRTRAALHELYFHPQDGIVACMLHLQREPQSSGDLLSFMNLGRIGRALITNRK